MNNMQTALSHFWEGSSFITREICGYNQSTEAYNLQSSTYELRSTQPLEIRRHIYSHLNIQLQTFFSKYYVLDLILNTQKAMKYHNFYANGKDKI